MKKQLFFLFLALLGLTQTAAQGDYEYIPFVREGVKWVCFSRCANNNYTVQPFTLELKGDAVINGKVYKAMHKYCGQEIDAENDTILIYLREDDRIVYGIVPDGKLYPGYPIGMDLNPTLNEKIANGEEFILYDFKDTKQFIESFVRTMPRPFYVIPEKSTIKGKVVNRFIFTHAGADYCLIDGIGYDCARTSGYPLGLFYQFDEEPVSYTWLSHVIEDGEVIYRSEYHKYKSVDELLQDDVLPIVREGVKWVNERVVIDHGVTTRNYYTYEFKGETTRHRPVCYEYTDSLANGTVAAVFNARYDEPKAEILRTEINYPYDKIKSEGRDMILVESIGYQLYQWDYSSNSDITYDCPLNYYIYNQFEWILNRENFVEVEPLTIENLKCRRFAYINEQEDTLCYVVEGIGFDSRDMGDLLTPFTKKPDPDADYQEYCGLSHVIKDGEIIYKGLRYDEDRVQAMYNDINGDGVVDVLDVTCLIAMILQSDSPTPHLGHNADVTDVVRLISYVLEH